MIINIKNVNINYEIYGEGEDTLLILHGWMACINAMSPIWQYFKNTKKVVVLDFPGQGGKSGTLIEAWGVPEYSEMVREFIEKLQLGKVDVIGHSFGGRVAIYLASEYSELFNKIVLTDSAGLKKKISLKKWLKIKTFKCGKFFLKCLYKNEKFEEKLAKLRKKFGSSDYSALSSDVMRGTFNKVISLDLEDRLSKIKSPTLLIWGENDEDTPVYMGKKMEKLIPDAGLVVLKNSGHFSYLDSPKEYNLIVENFLNS